jgi:hypothetical protein
MQIPKSFLLCQQKIGLVFCSEKSFARNLNDIYKSNSNELLEFCIVGTPASHCTTPLCSSYKVCDELSSHSKEGAGMKIVLHLLKHEN